MSLRPVSCAQVELVHSSCLVELIAGLTALVQYPVQLLPGPHTAAPSHCAIRPPSRSHHRSPLSCHSPAIRGASILTLVRIYHLLPGCSVIHLSSFSLYLQPPSSIFQTLSFPFHPQSAQFTVSPFPLSPLPRGSDEGVRSVLINE